MLQEVGKTVVSLLKANIHDSEKIYEMQLIGFKALLDKYQDYETSPGAEPLEIVRSRFKYPQIDHYFIQLLGEKIGYICISQFEENSCVLSQMFVLPEFQGKGYAQQAIIQVEKLYPQAKKWTLDTIKQEEKNCHLYEKMGYKLTGDETKINDGMDIVYYAK